MKGLAGSNGQFSEGLCLLLRPYLTREKLVARKNRCEWQLACFGLYQTHEQFKFNSGQVLVRKAVL